MSLCNSIENDGSSSSSSSITSEFEMKDLMKLVNILQRAPGFISQKQLEDGSSTLLILSEVETCLSDEIAALEQFSRSYKTCREFSSEKHLRHFHDIFSALVKNRLCLFEWNDSLSHKHMHCVLICLRILLRDKNYNKVFLDIGGNQTLSQLFNSVTESYVYHGDGDVTTVEILKEIANILNKLCSDHYEREMLIDFGVHKNLVCLLFARDLSVLHCALQTLLGLVESPTDRTARSLVVELNSIEMLLQILQDYDMIYKKLAAQLLRILLTEQQAKEMVKVYDGLPVLLSLLHSDSVTLLWNIIWCLVLLSGDNEISNEIRLMGGIPLLLSMLHDRKFVSEQVANGRLLSNEQFDEQNERQLSLKAACCACLTELVVNDTNGQQTVQNNGIYLVALLILPPTHVPCMDSDVKPSKAFANLQAYAFRALRFLFSMERNRRHFKRLFPPDLFGAFIDIGHYNRNINAYLALVDKMNDLTEETLIEIRENVESCNQNRSPTHYISEYAILELLGSGAFGTVYKVQRKTTTQSYFAMKEINTAGVTFGKTSKERQTSVGAIISELSIIRKQLKHPNVVRYYKTFQQADKLYIVMELIEGASLAEHFTSLNEKHEEFSENRIWNIFFQLILALRYLHKEKGIVHRDLTPNNVMLGEKDKVTITDFGLAKQKQSDCSKMNSVVGTILYSCPEILKNEPYGEKADVWALGCILYQLCTLKPPFYSNNMLTLATKIVEANYDPLPAGTFSEKLSSTISICINPLPEKRPDIVGVASHIADLLLRYVDNVRKEEILLEKKLEREKRRTQKHYNEAQSHMRDYHSISILSEDRLHKLTSSGNGRDIKDEAELSCAFVEEIEVTRNARYQATTERRQHSVIVTPDWGTDEDESGTGEEISVPKALSRQSSSVIPRPPEGTPKSRRKHRNVEKSIHNLSVDLCGKSRDSGLSSGSPSPLRMTPVLCSVSTPNSEPFIPIGQKVQSSVFGKMSDLSCNIPNAPMISSPSDSTTVASPVAIHPTDATIVANPVAIHRTDATKVVTPVALRSRDATVIASPIAVHPNGHVYHPRPKSFTSFSDGVDVMVQRAWTSGRSRPISATALTISPRKVRPVTDPVLQMLDQCHRIIYLTQLPPTLYRNPRRRAVECFKRFLFDSESSAINIKNELHKLLTESRDIIDLNIGLTDSTSKLARQVSQEQEAMAIASNSKSGFDFELDSVDEAGITYEEMSSIIESLLNESGYYALPNNQIKKIISEQNGKVTEDNRLI